MKITEDAPMNAAGSGGVDGMGVGSKGEPGKKGISFNVFRRKPLKEEIKPLYVCRKVLNGSDLIAWAKSQGFKQCLASEDFHITIAYSKDKLLWPAPLQDSLTLKGDRRKMDKFGDCTVLRVESDALANRWQQLKDIGASWDFPDYNPHITISYEAETPKNVVPYTGAIELGPEVFKEITDDEFAGFAEVKLMEAIKRLIRGI